MKIKRFWSVVILLPLLGSGCTEAVVEEEMTTTADTPNAQEAQAPTFTEITDTFLVGGAPMWLFAVNDGNANPALSMERDGAIWMGRLNLENPDEGINWTRAVNSSDIGGSRVADHWHVFGSGYHWLAFSVQEANASYLLKLDPDFKRMSLTPIVNNSDLPTNDLFLVDEADGVTVGHFKPGYGHRLYRMNLDGKLLGTLDVGGAAARHGNGSSAYRTDDGFTVIAGRTLNFLEQSPLYKLDYNQNWNLVAQTTLVDDEKKNVSMTSAVELPSGYVVVTARTTESYPRGQLPPPKNPGEPLSDDGGAIVRFVFDAAGQEIAREVLQSGTTEHRPHMALVGDLLITSWDGAGGSKLRVDRVE